MFGVGKPGFRILGITLSFLFFGGQAGLLCVAFLRVITWGKIGPFLAGVTALFILEKVYRLLKLVVEYAFGDFSTPRLESPIKVTVTLIPPEE